MSLMEKTNLSFCKNCLVYGTLIEEDGFLYTYGCIKCGNTWQTDKYGNEIN